MPDAKQQREFEERMAEVFPEYKAKLDADQQRIRDFLKDHVAPTTPCGECGTPCRIHFDAQYGADTYHCWTCGYSNYVEY